MDGGGDNQLTVHFLLSQENRRRVYIQRRSGNSIRFPALPPGFRTGPGPGPVPVPVPVPDEGVPGVSRLALIMAELAEDSGFESDSEGE